MNGNRDKARLRYNIMMAVFVVVGILVMFKMFVVMFFERSYWNDVSRYSVKWDITIPAKRGNILSDEGLLMASSLPQYRVHLDFATSERGEKRRAVDQQKKDSMFLKYLDDACLRMHEIYPSMSVQEFKSYYQKGKSQKTHWYALIPGNRPLSYNQYKALRAQMPWLTQKNYGWFYTSEEQISRKKPFGSLATRTLGDLFGAKDSARYGLELSFDSLLRGTPGIGHQEKIQNVSRIVADVPQIDGCDVVTTLNIEMQDIAERALRRELELVNAISGVAVLMEVPTGDIKAMTSLTRNGDGYYEVQNNAVKELFEPGSTFKSVSMMIGIDDGKISINDSVFCENGSYRFHGVEMTDHNKNRGGYGMLSVPEVLMYSSNIGTAKLIHKAYGDNPTDFVDGIYRIGVNRHFTMQLTGTAAPVVRRDGYWDATRLPWMSIGYNSQLPVINTVTFYNAIANGGKMVEPRLVTKVVKDGRTVQEFPVVVANKAICKESTLKDMQYMLERVVTDGLAKQAGSEYFRVAGKTGTAQVSKGSVGYKSGATNYLLSFCGYFPADKPQYSMIVAIRTAGGVASGGGIAGPVFHEISEKVMARTNTRSLALAEDTIRGKMPRVLSGDLSKAEKVMKKMKIDAQWGDLAEFDRDSVWGTTTRQDENVVLNPREYHTNLVPNVVGMGAQDALYLLESVGLKVGISGVGRVYSQSIPAGTAIGKGNYITIRLRM